MIRHLLPLSFAFLACLALAGSVSAQPSAIVPATPREFRGAWVATVANIDWPSRPGLTTQQQKAELTRILDRARELNLNAIVFQVRPACDALYPSKFDPWSAFLTGAQGRTPVPAWDPLEFAVEEAHARGLQLHAWLNPFRSSHPSDTSPVAANHISKRRPDLVRKYGKYMWLDPGEKEVQDYTLEVIGEILDRYDVDAIHFDDYFYPYVERDKNDKAIPFPDAESFKRYQSGGGKLSRDDWRRDNVNAFIRRTNDFVHSKRPDAMFGVSPFGIWRPGNPKTIKGMDAYSEIYVDSRKWLQEGWLDYLAPQLYWPVEPAAQSYPVLLDWWRAQNTKNRHIWPGIFTSRVGDGSKKAFTVAEIVDQVRIAGERPGSTGTIHFSMKPLLSDRQKLATTLREGAYAQPALVPASPWLDGKGPSAPMVRLEGTTLHLLPGGTDRLALWTIAVQTNGKWRFAIIPATEKSFTVDGPKPSVIAASAVDRAGNESPRAIVKP